MGPLVGAVGVLLLVSLFLEWYDGLTGFTVFEFVDIGFVVCVLLIIVQLAGGMGLLSGCLPDGLRGRAVRDRGGAHPGGQRPAGGGRRQRSDQAVGIRLAVGGAA